MSIYSDITNRNKPEVTRSPQLYTHIRVFSGWLFLTASCSCFPCRMELSCPCWRNLSFPTQTIWITWDQAVKQSLQTNRGGSSEVTTHRSTYHTCTIDSLRFSCSSHIWENQRDELMGKGSIQLNSITCIPLH